MQCAKKRRTTAGNDRSNQNRSAKSVCRSQDRRKEGRKKENIVQHVKKYINNAITEEEEVTENAYNAFRGENAKLKSVKESKMVTAMMIINIDRALTELEAESRREGTLYKYEAFRMHYIDGLTFEEIADQLDCGKNSPSNWCKAILKKMSVKLFGINGI